MTKYLNINIYNQIDINNFYKKLKYYKLFYKNYLLKLNIGNNIIISNKEMLQMCEKAFNIKNRNDRLEYVYDAICDYHDKIYIDTNICEFDKNGLCICQREYHHPAKTNGCCGTCTYMGKNGCTIKSIACKSFFCRYIRKKKNIPSHRKNALYKYFLTRPQKIIADVNYWNTKEENLKIMKKNSFIYIFFMKDKKMKRW